MPKKKDATPNATTTPAAEQVKTKEVPSQVFVSKTFKKQGAPEDPNTPEPEVFAVHRFVTEPARVEVQMGLTINLGNYESARVSVGVVVPCYREEIEDAYQFAHGWAEKRVQAEVDDIRNAAKANTTKPIF
jgi:hypothetical protein